MSKSALEAVLNLFEAQFAVRKHHRQAEKDLTPFPGLICHFSGVSFRYVIMGCFLLSELGSIVHGVQK